MATDNGEQRDASNVGLNPQPSRRRIDARGPSMLTDLDNITPELTSSSSNAAGVTSSDGGDGGGAPPKNPFDSSAAEEEEGPGGGGGTGVSSPTAAALHLVQAESAATAAGCAAAVQLAAEELLQHVQEQSAMAAPGSKSTGSRQPSSSQNPFSDGGGGGDASVCSNASSFRSVPSVDTATLGGGGGSATSPRGSYIVGGGSSSSAYPTPSQAQAPAQDQARAPPQPPYSCPPTTPAHHAGGGAAPASTSSRQKQRSPGDTPDLAGAASAIQMPALYLAEGGGGGSVGPAVSSPTHSYAAEASGVLLGVQQLERQQADWEAAKRNSTGGGAGPPGGWRQQQRPGPQAVGPAPNPQVASPRQQQQQGGMMATPNPTPTPGGQGQGQQHPPAYLEYRQPAQLPPPPLHEHDFHDDSSLTHNKPLVVYGYLKKQTRNGVWQRRFFETDGEFLSYYKSQKRTKLLATLDLAKVGEIAEDPTDLSGCTFAIGVAGRPYFLRAEDRSTCKDWVINLNRVREARIQVGRIKLVDMPAFHQYDDGTHHRKESGDEYISRVVVTANRNRTSRLNDDEVWKTLYEQEKEEEIRLQRQIAASAAMHGGDNTIDSSAAGGSITASGANHQADAAKFALPLQAMARWEKRATNFQVMRMRLVRWARRIRMMRCSAREQDVVLHPVGVGTAGRGDDPSSAVHSFDTNFGHSEDCNTVGDSESHSHNDPGISRGGIEDKGSGGGGYPAWIGKETQIHLAAAQGSAVTRRRTDAVDPGVPSVPVSPREGVDDDDDERTIS